MSTFQFTNRPLSTLAGPITNVATTANLAAGTGILFATLGAGQQQAVTFISASNPLIVEIAYIQTINNGGDQITSMLRGQEGTSALPWNAGDLAQGLITAGTLAAFNQGTGASLILNSTIITVSGVFVMANTGYAYGLNRTSSIATSSTTLPSTSAIGQEYTIEDLASNFNAFPVTVSPPGGQTIQGQNSVVLNVNRSCTTFRYFGANIWSASGPSI